MLARWSSMLLAAFVLLVPASGCRAAEAAWTMMMYLACDNDLEAPQLADLEEMLSVGSTAQVRIVALCDRSAEDDEDGGYSGRGVGGLDDWTGGKLLAVEKGKLVELDDWGDVDSGDPATLQKFIAAATARYPANKYALVLGDHGMAWPGICADEGTDNMLSTQEVAAVLEATKDASGELALLGFDACLMGNLETAFAMAPYAATMVASEELEPGDGWAYDVAYAELVRNPAMDGPELGQIIADSFYASYAEQEDGAEAQVTLSVIDLDQIADLCEAVDALAQACGQALDQDGRQAWLRIARARARSEQYGLDDDARKEGGEDAEAPNVRDLGDFVSRLKADLPAVAEQADAVLAQLTAAVWHNVAGKARPRASGLSIYFPADPSPLAADGPDSYRATEFANGTVWPELLQTLGNLAATDDERPALSEAATSDADLGADEAMEVTAEVDADDLDEAWFVLAAVDGDEQIVLGQLPTWPDEDGQLREQWDAGWFTIASGDAYLVCPIIDFDVIDEDEDTWYIEVPVQRLRGGKVDDLSLFFVLQDTEEGTIGEFVTAYKETKHGTREVTLGVGDVLQPIYLFVDADGNVEEIVSDDPADGLVVGNGLEVAYEAVDAGTYLVGFVTTDLAGNVAESYVQVDIE